MDIRNELNRILQQIMKRRRCDHCHALEGRVLCKNNWRARRLFLLIEVRKRLLTIWRTRANDLNCCIIVLMLFLRSHDRSENRKMLHFPFASASRGISRKVRGRERYRTHSRPRNTSLSMIRIPGKQTALSLIVAIHPHPLQRGTYGVLRKFCLHLKNSSS